MDRIDEGRLVVDNDSVGTQGTTGRIEVEVELETDLIEGDDRGLRKLDVAGCRIVETELNLSTRVVVVLVLDIDVLRVRGAVVEEGNGTLMVEVVVVLDRAEAGPVELFEFIVAVLRFDDRGATGGRVVEVEGAENEVVLLPVERVELVRWIIRDVVAAGAVIDRALIAATLAADRLARAARAASADVIFSVDGEESSNPRLDVTRNPVLETIGIVLGAMSSSVVMSSSVRVHRNYLFSSNRFKCRIRRTCHRSVLSNTKLLTLQILALLECSTILP